MRRTISGLPRSLLTVNAALFATAMLGGLTFGRAAGVLFAVAIVGAVASVQTHGERSRRRDRQMHREAARLSDGKSAFVGWTWERRRDR